GERGHRSRHRRVRVREYSALVERDGLRALSACDRTHDYRGWRGQQQQPQSTLEEVAAVFGGRIGNDLEDLSLSAGHQQVEQDRASAVLLHYQKLAWASAHDLRGHSQPDREHHHEDGSHRSRRVGPTPIRNRNYGQRRATRTPPPHASKVPRGMELLDQTTTLKLVKVISSPCLRPPSPTRISTRPPPPPPPKPL